MRPYLSRSLVALVSLLLALPPGWCCGAPLPGERDALAPTRHSCCPVSRNASPAEKPAHPRKQAPADRGGCACPDRASATADGAKSVPVEMGLPLTAARPLAIPVFPGAGGAASAGQEVPSPTPHLLHCVWLC
jgi:hypothetical protein